MLYGYARVSTKSQANSGNGLEAQKRALLDSGVLEEHIYLDAVTGKTMDRKDWNKLYSLLKKGDTVRVTRPDRLGRTLIDSSVIVNDLIERGVIVDVLTLGVLDNTPASKATRNMFFTFAELERDLIIERTREGREIARQKKGYKEGRPKKFKPKQLDHALSLLKDNTLGEVEKLTGISISTLKREIARRKQAALEKNRI